MSEIIYLITMDSQPVARYGYFLSKYDAYNAIFDSVGDAPEYDVQEIHSNTHVQAN